MRRINLSRFVLLPMLAASPGLAGPPEVEARQSLRHFVYFGLDRHRISEPSFLEHPGIDGAQLKYTWRELEPRRDEYDLSLILDDLAFLEAGDKRLFIQIQDVSFEEQIINVPDYLLNDPSFNGGVARQYRSADDAASPPIGEGWVARRWDPSVRDRFVKLLTAMGTALDGRIEGINLAETSIGFGGRSSERFPPGYTPAAYYESIKRLMSEAKRAMPRSHVIVYANFMPGEELPDAEQGYLRGVYEHADRIGVGVGGPDLKPLRWWQRVHSYPLIAARGEGTVAGVAVQWGNLDERQRETGERITAQELLDYAHDELHLDYLFWGTQEPYYTRDVLPLLAAGAGDPH